MNRHWINNITTSEIFVLLVSFYYVIIRLAKCMKFLNYFHWRTEGNSTFRFRTQNKGNCFSFIIRLRISLYAFCNMHIVYNPKTRLLINVYDS